MEPVAERPSSGWWVAATIPGKTLKFAENLGAEHYLPKENNKTPLASYVFVRAIGRTDAWMTPGFKKWLTVGSIRAIVSDAELNEFRSTVELCRVRAAKPVKQFVYGIIRRTNAAQDLRRVSNHYMDDGEEAKALLPSPAKLLKCKLVQ